MNLIESAKQARKRQIELENQIITLKEEILSEQQQELRDLGISVTPTPGALYDPEMRYLRDDTCISRVDGKTYKALRYLKDQSPEDFPQFWEEVPSTAVYLAWVDDPEMFQFYEGDLRTHEGFLWESQTQHLKSSVTRPRDGSSHWTKRDQ